ncbi:hypothetical protein [Gordonia polyisoprenivorans]|uniref:hypothetical protein n=1 Tax=Gordonia polyisoprenivorans TaxID=84595 RepID=UPI0023013F02|nr:hypothetical protein [Gordonia polyisoprenivorans]WCB36923.1 hypothetical protein PHA63_23180 [Gordonia polyisoprenivorans]
MTEDRPQTPRVPARRGARRVDRKLTELLGNQVSRVDVMRVLEDPEALVELSQSAEIILWDGRKPLIRSMFGGDALPLADLHPVRRIGTFHGARSRFAFHPTAFAGHPHLVLCESLLEAAWLAQFDRRPEHWGYIAQAGIVRWRLGDKQIVHVPDILGQDVGGHQWIADVRYSLGMATYSGLIMDRLMRATCVASNFDYQIFTDLRPQRRKNLSALSGMRWRQPVTEFSWWPAVSASRL